MERGNIRREKLKNRRRNKRKKEREGGSQSVPLWIDIMKSMEGQRASQTHIELQPFPGPPPSPAFGHHCFCLLDLQTWGLEASLLFSGLRFHDPGGPPGVEPLMN